MSTKGIETCEKIMKAELQKKKQTLVHAFTSLEYAIETTHICGEFENNNTSVI